VPLAPARSPSDLPGPPLSPSSGGAVRRTCDAATAADRAQGLLAPARTKTEAYDEVGLVSGRGWRGDGGAE
jgi:hypothetical protein